MELAIRKEKILKAVVESYIQSGEPIGSKTLQSETDLGVSSATIRNELADLVAKGYLVQPHTSAGRVPSHKGYRYYVDNLIEIEQPSQRIRSHIEHVIRSGADAPETILSKTAQVLADLCYRISTSRCSACRHTS